MGMKAHVLQENGGDELWFDVVLLCIAFILIKFKELDRK